MIRLFRSAGDVPIAADKRLRRNVRILLSKERYKEIPENIKIEEIQLSEFEDNDNRYI